MKAMVKIFLWRAILALSAASIVQANVMPVSGNFDPVVLLKGKGEGARFRERAISLEKENLTIIMTEQKALVRAEFWLRNTSSSAQARIIVIPTGPVELAPQSLSRFHHPP